MITRVTYNRIDNNLVTDWYTIGPNYIIRATINTEDKTYTISEFDSAVVKEGDYTKLSQAKIQIKKELKALGAKFNDEIRRHSTP